MLFDERFSEGRGNAKRSQGVRHDQGQTVTVCRLYTDQTWFRSDLHPAKLSQSVGAKDDTSGNAAYDMPDGSSDSHLAQN